MTPTLHAIMMKQIQWIQTVLRDEVKPKVELSPTQEREDTSGYLRESK